MYEIEIILINDGSTDDSLEILNNYQQKDDRIKIINQKNNGPGDARNNAIKASSSDVLAFVDSDDCIELNMLEDMYNKLFLDYLDIVYVKLNYLKSDGTVSKTSLNYSLSDDRDSLLKKMIASEISSCIPLGIYKKSLFVDNKVFFPLKNTYEDVAVAYRVLYFSKKASFINKPYYNYSYNENSRSNLLTKNNFKDMYAVISDTKKFLLENEIYEYYEDDYFRKIEMLTRALLSTIKKNSISQNNSLYLLNILWDEIRQFKDVYKLHLSKIIYWTFISLLMLNKLDDKEIIPLVKKINVSTNIIENILNSLTSPIGLLRNIIKQLDYNPLIKNVYIYGAGESFDVLLPYLKKRDIKLIGLVDKQNIKKTVDGVLYEAKLIDQIAFLRQTNYIIVASIAYASDITNEILVFKNKSGIKISVINYYNPLFPV